MTVEVIGKSKGFLKSTGSLDTLISPSKDQSQKNKHEKPSKRSESFDNFGGEIIGKIEANIEKDKSFCKLSKNHTGNNDRKVVLRTKFTKQDEKKGQPN